MGFCSPDTCEFCLSTKSHSACPACGKVYQRERPASVCNGCWERHLKGKHYIGENKFEDLADHGPFARAAVKEGDELP